MSIAVCLRVVSFASGNGREDGLRFRELWSEAKHMPCHAALGTFTYANAVYIVQLGRQFAARTRFRRLRLSSQAISQYTSMQLAAELPSQVGVSVGMTILTCFGRFALDGCTPDRRVKDSERD